MEKKKIDGVTGRHDRDGRVVIEFNGQGWKLPSPSGGQYLPCLECGQVYDVDDGVAAFRCQECADRDEREDPEDSYASDGRVHVRRTPGAATMDPALCGRRGQETTTSAWGFYGPGGDGFDDMCKACVEAERARGRGRGASS